MISVEVSSAGKGARVFAGPRPQTFRSLSPLSVRDTAAGGSITKGGSTTLQGSESAAKTFAITNTNRVGHLFDERPARFEV